MRCWRFPDLATIFKWYVPGPVAADTGVLELDTPVHPANTRSAKNKSTSEEGLNLRRLAMGTRRTNTPDGANIPATRNCFPRSDQPACAISAEVVTVTVELAELPPGMIELGFALQLENAGVPVHVS